MSLEKNNLSLIYLELGEYDKSIEHAKNALDINGEYHDAKYNLALSLFEKKNYAESLFLAKNLINVESHKAKAYELKIRIEQLICDWSSYENTNELLSKNKIIVHPFLHPHRHLRAVLVQNFANVSASSLPAS